LEDQDAISVLKACAVDISNLKKCWKIYY
jgi:hypothetical protein